MNYAEHIIYLKKGPFQEGANRMGEKVLIKDSVEHYVNAVCRELAERQKWVQMNISWESSRFQIHCILVTWDLQNINFRDEFYHN